LFAAGNVELRIDAVALGALMHMPRKDWHRSVLSFDRQRLERLRTAITAWIGARSLSHAAFEAKLVDLLTSDNAIKKFRAAAKGAQTAQTHQDLKEASGHLAAGMQSVGLDKWPGFLRDAADRAETYQPSDGRIVLAQVAINTATDASPSGDANADRSMSAQGQAALMQREGQAPGGGYYNDTAQNCTYGIGLLAHTGPCTADELRRAVNPQQAQAEFQRRVNEAERRVRDQVRDRRLTQNQFDSLVSTAFNTRNRDNQALLNAANQGDDAAVQRQRESLVHTHDHNARGEPVGPARRDRGLVNRRRSEQEQYDRPDGPQ